MRESALIAHKPAGMSFEEAAAVCDGATQRAVVPETGGSPEGAEDPHLRRIGIHRHRRGAAGQVLRSRRHCGVQHQEPRDCQIARSRPGDRLHAGRLHQERPDLRRHLRRGRQALVQAVQRLTEAGGIYLATDGLPNLLALWTSRIGDKKVIFPIPPATPRRTSSSSSSSSRRGIPGGHRPALPAGGRGRGARYVETEQKTGNVVLTVDA